jgi:uncharacterized membrane protein YsdA (DUF1294 family)
MVYVLIAVGVYLAMSVTTFTAFALDKRRAKLGKWRISEKTLLLLSLAFGWPGAWLAMKLVRHKTKTRKFVIGVPLIAGLHLAVWAGVGWLVYQG